MKLQFVALFFLFTGCTSTESFRKEYLSTYSTQSKVYATHGAVSSIHPLASKVGKYILEQGGNAIDAAIATELALAVVYPEAGNIGGGGFMIVRLKDGTTKALDFRETAPEAARKDMYLDSNGDVADGKSIHGHLACGVPGTIAGIFEAMKFARLPFRKLIQPAIDLAEKGYAFRLNIGNADPKVNTQSSVFTGGRAWEEGEVFKQPDLAATLKRIRDYGRKDFYEGQTARLIVAEMKRGGGIISLDDLKGYQAKWREPHQFEYRGCQIISMPLPSSGGILLQQMLKMVEPYPVGEYGFGSIKAISLEIEVERRAYRDRAAYLGDIDFENIPVKKLISDSYLAKKMNDYRPGIAGKSVPLEDTMLKPESYETTHLTVVDADGNAVSLTTTLNGPFGCGVVVGGAGFFLNNEMDDFCVKLGKPNSSGGIGGYYNTIKPRKRMLSSMTPTIVVKDGKLLMALGTPGGSRIPTAVFQAIVNTIDFKMTGDDAVNKPKIHHEWWPDEVFVSKRFPADTIAKLSKMGYDVKDGSTSNLELIKVVRPGLLEIVSEHGCAEGY